MRELTEQETSEIDDLFTYHAPTEEQRDALIHVRNAAKAMARTIYANCPPSADRTAAVRKLRESVMTANASIVLPPIPR